MRIIGDIRHSLGSYTTNYEFYLPNVGEQGWGDLVNSNFTNLDTILKSGAGIRAATSAQADKATKLTTARAINGTSFDGTASITTAFWGTARKITITDGTNTGDEVSVNGSGDVSLKLPTTINLTTTNATYATNADKLMMYEPAGYAYYITTLSATNSWTAEYSGIVGISTPSNSALILCNGYKYLYIASNSVTSFCVVAGSTYSLSNPGSVSVNIYGNAYYR